jgi:uncharacterized protein
VKYLVLLLVLGVAIMVWRARRPAPPPSAPKERRGKPAKMVRCAACGVHLPLADAERSLRGVYCSPEHRRQIEG